MFGIVLLAGLLVFGGQVVLGKSEKNQTHQQEHDTNSTQALLETLPSPHTADKLPSITSKPIIAARSYIVIDSETKYPLALKNPDDPVPIASTTKIMTATVALETLPLDQVVTISSKAATTEGSQLFLRTGEQMTVKNLIYALLLNSANDAAVALAEAGGSYDAFVAAMNDKARLLGLKHTNYRDPAGLDDEGHSTPRDLAILMEYALRNPLFKQIAGTYKHTITSYGHPYSEYELTNSNRLVKDDDPFYYPNAVAGKTGFTYAAGHCLVSVAEHPNGKRYIAVVLSTYEDSKPASARESRKLLEWASHQQSQ